MGEETTEQTEEQGRSAWLQRLCDEFLKLEALMPVKFPPEGEQPAWVVRVEEEMAKVMFPVADLKAGLATPPGLTMTPKRVGAMLGHQCANAVWMMEWFGSQEAAARLGGGKFKLSPESIEKARIFEESMAEWYSAMRRLAKRALCSAVDQSYADMAEFLMAYSEAFARKLKTFNVGEIGNPNFEVYLLMLTLWPIIERLSSARQLHEVLVKVFGHRAGELKRTEKICQRIGKSFRKPGRPPKAEIQTPA